MYSKDKHRDLVKREKKKRATSNKDYAIPEPSLKDNPKEFQFRKVIIISKGFPVDI